MEIKKAEFTLSAPMESVESDKYAYRQEKSGKD